MIATASARKPAHPYRSPASHRLRKSSWTRATVQPQLSVVIVNYCRWHDTARLVGQLQDAACMKEGTAEIVVVDNHSPYHPLASRLRREPGVSVRRWSRNRGYARAVNEGCRLSRGTWMLVLNPDITVEPRFLDEALALANRLTVDEPRAGVVGFHLRNPDQSLQRSCGFFPNLVRTLVGVALPRARRKCVAITPSRRCPVSWVTGCCVLLRRECLQQLGGFDEDFFLYYEDVDLCRRARTGGWSIWYEPALRAVHHRPLHSRRVSVLARLCTRHALLLYGAKHWAGWEFLLLASLVQMEAWLKQFWAGRRGDRRTARLFGKLRRIAAEVTNGRHSRARRRLEQVVLQEERRLFS